MQVPCGSRKGSTQHGVEGKLQAVQGSKLALPPEFPALLHILEHPGPLSNTSDMTAPATLSRRSVAVAQPSAQPSAPSWPFGAPQKVDGYAVGVPADCMMQEPAKPAYPTPSPFDVPCPASPQPSANMAHPSMSSGMSYKPSSAPSSAAYGMPPPAPSSQYAPQYAQPAAAPSAAYAQHMYYGPPAEDKVQSNGCGCTPEVGCAILGGIALVGLFVLRILVAVL